MSNRKGFTLVELLVVVGIIALLVAIMVPALAEARQLAIQTKCVTQLRQLITATYMYANDNHQLIFWRLGSIQTQGMEYFTWVGREGRGAGETENTHTAQGGGVDLFNTQVPRPLNTYINNAYELAHCPGDINNYDRYGVYGADNWYEMTGNSYTFNCAGHPLWWPSYRSNHPGFPSTAGAFPGGLRGKKLSEVARPSQTVFALDSGLYRVPDDGSSWHQDGKANIAFCDGHAELRTLPLANPYIAPYDNDGLYWDANGKF